MQAGVAQLAEQLICNQQVAGSSPIASSKIYRFIKYYYYVLSDIVFRYPYGGVPEWLKGTDCKSVGSAFGGSNPPPSTNSSSLYGYNLRAGIAQLVEHQPSKLRVASSSLVSRSIFRISIAHVAQLVERILGKDEVTGSTPVVGSREGKAKLENKFYKA